MKANKKVMAALLAAMMSVSAGAAVVSAEGIPVAGIGSEVGSNLSTGWRATVHNGKTFYSYEISDGQYATGWKLIDGAWYFFAYYDTTWTAQPKTTTTGVATVDTYFALVDTAESCLTADGTTPAFRFDADGKMITGWYQLSNAKDPTYGDSRNWEYYSPSTGVKQDGWIKVGANWFYMTFADTVVEYTENGRTMTKVLPQGTLLMDGTYTFVDEYGTKKTYSFAANGVLLNQGQGWVQEGGNWYWVQEDGTRFTGSKADLVTYTASSWNLINGKYYLFDENGVMQTGWKKVVNGNGEVKWYYMTGNGDCVLNSWVFVGNNWYLLNASGEMVTGFAVRGGKTYLLNPTAAGSTDGVISTSKYVPYGAMVTGAVSIKDENGKYMEMVFDSNGALVSINNNFVAPGTIPTLPNGITIPTPGM